MFPQEEKAGTVDVSCYVRALDSTTGAPVTSIAYNSSGIDMKYRRDGGAPTAITEATLSAGTDAHSDGGFLHIDQGICRLDLPDAACSAGAKKVLVSGVATGVVFVPALIKLVAYDPYDAVRLGLTALPNAAAEAAGGLLTRGSGAGQVNQDANGRIDVNLKAADSSTTAATLLMRFFSQGVVLVTITGSSSTTKSFVTTLTETTPDHYQDRALWWLTGALAGQVSVIQYSSATGVLTPYKAATDAPANGDLGIFV